MVQSWVVVFLAWLPMLYGWHGSAQHYLEPGGGPTSPPRITRRAASRASHTRCSSPSPAISLGSRRCSHWSRWLRSSSISCSRAGVGSRRPGGSAGYPADGVVAVPVRQFGTRSSRVGFRGRAAAERTAAARGLAAGQRRCSTLGKKRVFRQLDARVPEGSQLGGFSSLPVFSYDLLRSGRLHVRVGARDLRAEAGAPAARRQTDDGVVPGQLVGVSGV
jgi:hypothetical protein